MSWLSRFGNVYQKKQHEEIYNPTSNMDDQLDELIGRYHEIIEKKEQEKDQDDILFHFTVVMPLFEIFLCTKKAQSAHSQVFCRLRMSELNFQRLSNQTGRIDYLFAIDNIELVNEQPSIKKFETVFRKKIKASGFTEDESDEFLSRANSEFDDEESLDTDNMSVPGLFRHISKTKDFKTDPIELLNASSNPPLVLLSYTITTISSNQNEISQDNSIKDNDMFNLDEYETSIRLHIQHFEIFYDALLIRT